jgi:hypothetical protein
MEYPEPEVPLLSGGIKMVEKLSIDNNLLKISNLDDCFNF